MQIYGRKEKIYYIRPIGCITMFLPVQKANLIDFFVWNTPVFILKSIEHINMINQLVTFRGSYYMLTVFCYFILI